MTPDPSLVARFREDIAPLLAEGGTLGVAVSGGPDSLALLLLAAAAFGGRVEAATVDHGLRPESAAEAGQVARICARLGVPHRVLAAQWDEPPASNIQARARDLRYRLLGDWAADRSLGAVATAHHRDDQAETFLMRAARGSGLAGLSAMRPSRPLAEGIRLVRPLLGWSRSELRAIVVAAGVEPVADPSNSDERFDRVRARRWLASGDAPDAERVAAAAAHLADAADALDWAARTAFAERVDRSDRGLSLDPSGLPIELQRRLLAAAIHEVGGVDPPGPKLMAALSALAHGDTVTLAGVKMEGGPRWRLTLAPPHRR